MIMKKVLIILLLVWMGIISVSAQEQNTSQEDSTSMAFNALEALTLGTIVEDIGKYKLYPTENMWTFLKLNTQTGQVYQVQYSIKDDNYGEVVVNRWSLNSYGDPYINGRYELYPTQNMYNFLLLDKNTGAVYQVQWSMKAENRGLYKISEYED